MKEKIIVLSEYVGEGHNSTAYYWSQIVKSLQGSYDIVLIAPKTTHVINFSTKYNINLKAVTPISYNKNNIFSRLWGQIRQTLAFISVFRREINFCPLVFSGTNPIVTMLIMVFLRKVKKFRWVLLVHDIFPNNLVPANIIKKESVLFKLLMPLSKFMYSEPDSLICIGRDMKCLLESKVNSKASIYFVPNWASSETAFSCPKSENKILLELGWVKNIVFQFFGNMGRLQGIDNLLNAIALSNHVNARFLFIGDGSELSNVQVRINTINEKAGYNKVYYYGTLGLEDNLVGLNACDVAFVSLSQGMYGLGVPSKAYFSMVTDKPILYVGDKKSELSILLTEHEVGWFCEPNAPEKLASLIEQISLLYTEGTENKFKPRDVMTAHFSERSSLEKIRRVIDEVARI